MCAKSWMIGGIMLYPRIARIGDVDIDRDFWLDPQGAIDYGLADRIMTPKTWEEWIKSDKA